MLNKKALAASVSAPPAEYVEDVFSTYLYTGTSASQTITNNIDLAGKGGMVWIKNRSNSLAFNHVLQDSERGFTTGKKISSNLTVNQNGTNITDNFGYISGATSNGFTLNKSGSGSYDWFQTNASDDTYVSWTFRKAKKFFDVVTWTGTGSAMTINHNLGSAPGMIIMKKVNGSPGTGNWAVWHRGLPTDPGSQQYESNVLLNLTDANVAYGYLTSTPTSTSFSVSNSFGQASDYVAYLFAHNAGGFGTAGTDNIITCGSFTGASPATVNLGWEPQWLLIKSATNADNWYMFDTMRGWTANNSGLNYLIANTSGAEQLNGSTTPLTSTGFQFNYGSGETFIYVAIRRPMKTPTDATKVFNPVYGQSGAPAFRSSNFNAGVDTSFVFLTSGYNDGTNAYQNIQTRLIGTGQLQTGNNRAEVSQSYNTWDYMNGQNNTTFYDSTWGSWLFKRATGFHDVVCYTGNGANRTITHNLGVAPELIITKERSTTGGWATYSAGTGADKYFDLNDGQEAYTNVNVWNNTSPTSSVFSLGTSGAANGSGNTYVAYLFATVTGVSKVGSYTGTGSAQTINCGFTAGARFVMIKRTDSPGGWYVWDTVRGIVSGNDPYLLLNTYDAQVTNTDYIDPANSGFEISSAAPAAINANGGSFIFMAIA